MAGKTLALTYKISEDGQGMKQLVLDLDGVRKLTSSVVQEAKKFNAPWFRIGAITTSLKNMSDGLMKVSSVLKEATEGLISYDSAMRAANTMVGKDAAGFERMKDQVTELSKRVPVARDALANGLYQVISNVVPEDKKAARKRLGPHKKVWRCLFIANLITLLFIKQI